MCFIKADGIVKRYGYGPGAVEALRGIDLEIFEGEWVAVVGRSGSGKSTLLSVLGGLNSPTAGTYKVAGVELYALASEQRADFRREKMGFVFQSFHLLDYLSVLENVMLPLVTSSLPSRLKMELAREALERVGLQGKETRLPAEISGGEQQRVAIARAIVNRPLLLLADEPTGNLDSVTGEQVMKVFRDLHCRGMTIVMVTHSEQWASMAQRIIKMSDGRVIGNYHTGCSFESQFQKS